METLANFLKIRRKKAGFTQEALANRAGVALTVIRKIEQGQGNLNLEKANQVSRIFGHELAPVNSRDLKPSNEM